MPRFVLEGEWTGYTSAQQRVVHREIISKKFADAAKKLHTIVYTDGTALYVRVREAKFREQVKEIHSYTKLIREAVAKGGSRVLVAEL